MQEVFEKIIDEIKNLMKRPCSEENCQFGDSCCENKAFMKAIEIVKQESAEYEECYKDCGECEAYDKEKHHCPKFCKVITDSVNEIEENHNGWIPVSERLPEEHKLYDITFKNSAGIHSDEAIYIPFRGKWFWDADESEEVKNEIMAWAEKREPYQPNGEAKE